ncbi:hypothetical protein MNBD_GAMMA23-2246 [hydrothermal vent metagenome]|uniref:Uncharacterized protein n=1 Tax=hydrothermal vent metagenome TaxID=652676 RepID=A0A3B0ZV12_9ZZZZ
MKKTIVIFSSLFFWFAGLSYSFASESLISHSKVSHLVKDYYDTRSEWRGVFRMSNIEKIRLDEHDRNHITAYVRYQYVAIPSNHEGRRDEGHD